MTRGTIMKKGTNARKRRYKPNPDISIAIDIYGPAWNKYGRDLEKLVLENSWCFPSYKEGQTDFNNRNFGPVYTEGEHTTDNWGCVWYNSCGGYEGRIVKHPVETPEQFAAYRPPDSTKLGWLAPRPDWNEQAKEWKKAKREKKSTGSDFIFTFDRVQYLMSLENMMISLAEDDGFAEKVTGMVLHNNLAYIEKTIKHGPPGTYLFVDDFGTQRALMISPDMWKKFFKPGYRAMFALAHAAGSSVWVHSCGKITEILDDLVEIGMDSVNPQMNVNGIDELVEKLKGVVYIQAHLDRQQVLPFGTKQDVKDMVREVVLKLGSPKGGLGILSGVTPDMPLENIRILFETLKEYRHYWIGKA